MSAAIVVSAQKRKPKRKSPHRELVQIIGDAVNINSTPAGPPVFRDPFDPKVVAFVEAWRAIKNLYFDATFNGLNWDSVLKEMMPRVEAAKTNEEAEDLIREMLSRLNRSHLEVIPSSYYTGLATIKKISSEREEA